MLRLRDGSLRRMEDLRVGDDILSVRCVCVCVCMYVCVYVCVEMWEGPSECQQKQPAWLPRPVAGSPAT
jgi:hypothetical protein